MEVAVELVLAAEREARGRDRLRRRTVAHPDPPAVDERATTRDRVIRVPEHRRVHHADDRHTVVDEPHRHADRHEPVQEVRGAVERIDVPAPIRSRAAGLLAEERDTRRELFEHFARGLLAREVGRAHPVARRLLAHVARAPEVLEHHFATRAQPRGRRHTAARAKARSTSTYSGTQHVEQRLGARADELTPHRRIRRHQLLTARVNHDRTGFAAQQ